MVRIAAPITCADSDDHPAAWSTARSPAHMRVGFMAGAEARRYAKRVFQPRIIPIVVGLSSAISGVHWRARRGSCRRRAGPTISEVNRGGGPRLRERVGRAGGRRRHRARRRARSDQSRKYDYRLHRVICEPVVAKFHTYLYGGGSIPCAACPKTPKAPFSIRQPSCLDDYYSQEAPITKSASGREVAQQ